MFEIINLSCHKCIQYYNTIFDPHRVIVTGEILFIYVFRAHNLFHVSLLILYIMEQWTSVLLDTHSDSVFDLWGCTNLQLCVGMHERWSGASMKPLRQRHRKLPTVFTHSWSHRVPPASSHSSMSARGKEGKRVRGSECVYDFLHTVPQFTEHTWQIIFTLNHYSLFIHLNEILLELPLSSVFV